MTFAKQTLRMRVVRTHHGLSSQTKHAPAGSTASHPDHIDKVSAWNLG